MSDRVTASDLVHEHYDNVPSITYRYHRKKLKHLTEALALANEKNAKLVEALDGLLTEFVFLIENSDYDGYGEIMIKAQEWTKDV